MKLISYVNYYPTIVLLCLMIQSGDLLAAWKNLCPDHLHCPNNTRHYPAPGNVQDNDRSVTLPYFSGFDENNTIKMTTRLLVYPNHVEVPEWDNQLQPGGTFTQHSNGNWIAMRGIDETFILDSAGKLLNSFSHKRFLLFGFDVVKGPVFEKNGTVYFSLNNPIDGRFKIFLSKDAGESWRTIDDSTFGIKSVDLKGKDNLYPNPFGPGFYIIGRETDDKTFDSPKIFNISVSDEGIPNARHVDNLHSTTDLGARLNSIAFDYNPDNLEHPVLYAATNKGILTSRDKGRSWGVLKGIGLSEPVSNLTVIGDHQPKIIVASTENSGILASRNEGITWEPFARGLLDGKAGSGFQPAAVYYRNGQLLARTQGGWYRCKNFDCEGQATIAPAPLNRGTIPVVEFYNSTLDHYFMTSDNDEITGIDNGHAGANWSRTGFTFTAWTPLGLNSGKAVCRFYGSTSPGPNSHFFSASADECDALHQLQKSTPAEKPRWNFEGLPFMVAKGRVANAEACAEGHIPIYRAYNNGYARGVDSNHRFVADHAEIDKLVAKGWADEGIAFCALP